MTAITQADLARFAAEPSPAARARMAEKVGSIFGTGNISPAERRIALEIFNAMARDAAERVRAAVASVLRSSADIPKELAQRLASDVDQVSLPILEFSPLFTEKELVALVRSGTVARQAAVARRHKLPETVVEVIVDEAHPGAVATLMRNETVEVTEPTLERTLTKHGNVIPIQEALAHRRVLSVALAERLVMRASLALRDYIVAHHTVSPDVVAEVILDAREAVTLSLAEAPPSTQELVRSLAANGRLSETLVLRALCTGRFDFAEHALARLAGIPVAASFRLISDPVGLARLATRCNFSAAFVSVAEVALNVGRDLQYDGTVEGREQFTKQVVERVLTSLGESLAVADANYLLRRLSRGMAA